MFNDTLLALSPAQKQVLLSQKRAVINPASTWQGIAQQLSTMIPPSVIASLGNPMGIMQPVPQPLMHQPMLNPAPPSTDKQAKPICPELLADGPLKDFNLHLARNCIPDDSTIYNQGSFQTGSDDSSLIPGKNMHTGCQVLMDIKLRFVIYDADQCFSYPAHSRTFRSLSTGEVISPEHGQYLIQHPDAAFTSSTNQQRHNHPAHHQQNYPAQQHQQNVPAHPGNAKGSSNNNPPTNRSIAPMSTANKQKRPAETPTVYVGSDSESDASSHAKPKKSAKSEAGKSPARAKKAGEKRKLTRMFVLSSRRRPLSRSRLLIRFTEADVDFRDEVLRMLTPKLNSSQMKDKEQAKRHMIKLARIYRKHPEKFVVHLSHHPEAKFSIRGICPNASFLYPRKAADGSDEDYDTTVFVSTRVAHAYCQAAGIEAPNGDPRYDQWILSACGTPKISLKQLFPRTIRQVLCNSSVADYPKDVANLFCEVPKDEHKTKRTKSTSQTTLSKTPTDNDSSSEESGSDTDGKKNHQKKSTTKPKPPPKSQRDEESSGEEESEQSESEPEVSSKKQAKQGAKSKTIDAIAEHIYNQVK